MYKKMTAGVATLTCLISVNLPAAPGDLDTDFGTGGIVTTDIGGVQNFAQGFAVDSEGRIVGVTITGDIADRDFVVLRYLPDGTPDASFDGDGVVITPIGLENDIPDDVQADSANRIVVAGQVSFLAGNDIVLVRYNEDGSLDDGFASSGVATLEFPGPYEGANNLLVLPDGKLLVGGNVFEDRILTARFLADGSEDPSFGDGGVATFKVDDLVTSADDFALQSDGKLLVTGTLVLDTVPDETFRVLVARVNTDGSLDSSFGEGGFVTDAMGEEDASGVAIAVAPDGSLFVGVDLDNEIGSHLVILKLKSDGTLDTAFGTGGKIDYTLDGIAMDLQDLALQIDGSLLALGQIFSSDPVSDYLVVRLLPDGSFDTSFAGNGIFIQSVGGNDSPHEMEILPDGKILLGGSEQDVAVMRLLGNSAELSVVKESDEAEAKVDDEVTYTIRITNTGDDRAGVTLTDDLPSGLNLDAESVSTADGFCEAGSTLTCLLGVDPGETIEVTYNATAATEGEIVNTAVIVGQVVETETGDNDSSATLQVTPVSSGGCSLIGR